MSILYAKILNLYCIEEAEQNYKNISNFNLSPELMASEGFKPVTTLYEKATGQMVYFYTDEPVINPELYTDLTYPGYNYVWNATTNCWEIPLDVLKTEKGIEIRIAADTQAESFKVGYSKSEQDTWSRQEHGAKDLKADPASTTDDAEWVKLLASTRGITVTEQVDKILVAVAIANEAAARILGKQQKIEDLIKVAKTQAEVSLISWNMALK